MPKATKPTTAAEIREQILSLPDAPEGERVCDVSVPEEFVRAMERLSVGTDEMHRQWRDARDAADKRLGIEPDADLRNVRRVWAFETVTGDSFERIMRMSWRNAIRHLNAAADSKDAELQRLARETAVQLLRIKSQQPPPPLTDNQTEVLNLIRQHPEGIQGPAITRATDINQSTLTSSVIPVLKDHYGVTNKGGAGYYIEQP